jgi:release factor glutamine methyltransferase
VNLTVQTGLRDLSKTLAERGIPDPAREARLVLAHVMLQEPGRLTVLANDPLAAADMERAQGLVARRVSGEPMSHLLGYRDFFGRRFAVDPRVLDPRPETETLIVSALAEPFSRVLDLGTGSGAIALTLLAERLVARGVATDFDSGALEVARANAKSLGLSERVSFVQADWFDGIEGQFDLIVSNPPYIALDEMPLLQVELMHEPRHALTDEADGLTAYRQIAGGAGAHLAQGGRILVEIGPTQAKAVSALFAASGFAGIEVIPDLDGRDRVVLARKA